MAIKLRRKSKMEIRPLSEEYVPDMLDMMAEFFSSPAVSTGGSEKIFARNIAACLDPGAAVRGYVMAEDDLAAGYAITADAYSTEYGRPCVWIEDLYVREAYRGRGFGSAFLSFLEKKRPDALLRLEVAPDNEDAIRLYAKNGFRQLKYLELCRK